MLSDHPTVSQFLPSGLSTRVTVFYQPQEESRLWAQLTLQNQTPGNATQPPDALQSGRPGTMSRTYLEHAKLSGCQEGTGSGLFLLSLPRLPACLHGTLDPWFQLQLIPINLLDLSTTP